MLRYPHPAGSTILQEYSVIAHFGTNLHTIVFRGVRGSRTAADPRVLKHGGNTTCLEIGLPGDRRILLDCGSGLASVMDDLPAGVLEFHVFLTHYHLDHLLGLPFFRPLYDPRARFTFYGPETRDGDVQSALEGFMKPPWFPMPLAETASVKSYVALRDQPVELDRIRVVPRHVESAHASTVYRLERGDRSVVFATDVEPGELSDDAALVSLASGADVLIHDAQYTPAEYPPHRGWGHSTWQHAVEVAREAAVGRLILFHHHPSRTDREVEAIVQEARQFFPEVEAAREGMEVPL
jgi:phosphoribosyl 1,2-cyclic phosphodiesterase